MGVLFVCLGLAGSWDKLWVTQHRWARHLKAVCDIGSGLQKPSYCKIRAAPYFKYQLIWRLFSQLIVWFLKCQKMVKIVDHGFPKPRMQLKMS